MGRRPIQTEMNKKHLTKAEQATRIAEEQVWRLGKLEDYDPFNLDDDGLIAFKRISRSIPADKLAEVDGYTIEIAADAIAKMQQARKIINTQGMINADGDQNKAILVYQKYSDIAKKYLVELGCTPAARTKIAIDAAAAITKPKTIRELMAEDD